MSSAFEVWDSFGAVGRTQWRKRIIGGAGTGKTTRLMAIIEEELGGGVPVARLAFASFTRAARREAATRAAKVSGLEVDQLEGQWFRTIHSMALTCLPRGQATLAEGTAEMRQFLAEFLGDQKLPPGQRKPPAGVEQALAIWGTARARLVSLEEQYERAKLLTAPQWDSRTRQYHKEFPGFGRIQEIVERYEHAKRLDQKRDFADILSQYAGVRYEPDGTWSETQPRGVLPEIDVAIFDEQQDVSPLADRTAKRLCEMAERVYLAGDPFQAIYGFQGSDPSLFMAWEVDEDEIMPRSYRCPPAVASLGEKILESSSNYFDREIAPADHDGEVSYLPYEGIHWGGLDPNDDILIVARATFLAEIVGEELTTNSIPWVGMTQGMRDWHGENWKNACYCLHELQLGRSVDKYEMMSAATLLPTSLNKHVLMERGVKASFDRKHAKFAQIPIRADLSNIHQWGFTKDFCEIVRDGDWPIALQRVDKDGKPRQATKATAFVKAREKWGMDTLRDPKIRIGTIHGVKGLEADKVYWITSTTQQVAHAVGIDSFSRDEEIRLAYVAATRARRELVVANHQYGYRAKVLFWDIIHQREEEVAKRA